mgnify:FL=1
MIEGMNYYFDSHEKKTIKNALKVYRVTLQTDIDALGLGQRGTQGEVSEWYKAKLEELMEQWEETGGLIKRLDSPTFEEY